MNERQRYKIFQRLLHDYKRGAFLDKTFYQKVRDLFWEEVPEVNV